MSVSLETAWDFALGLLKVDGLEPSEEFLDLVEKEKRGEITEKDIEEWLNKKYKTKRQEQENERSKDGSEFGNGMEFCIRVNQSRWLETI